MDFFARYKKLFFILGFFGLVFFIGYLIYSLFFKPLINGPENTTTPTATTTAGSGLPTANNGTGGQVVTGSGGILSPAATTTKPGTESQPDPTAAGNITKTATLVQDSTLAPTLSSNGNGLQYYNQNDGKFYRVTPDGQAVALSDKVFHSVESVTWSPNKNKAVLEYPDGANIIYDFDKQKQITLPSHWKDFSFSPDGEK
ncbi:hypothetical protein HGA64_05725, partial [Candidatus Falkowbacteria bacterium]|nr:hypothetical protein [Candidatus Falkowbacteria bacterium]